MRGRRACPQAGVLAGYTPPTGPGVRVDTGVVSGDVVSGSFDSMLALTNKLRTQLIRKTVTGHFKGMA